MLITCTCCYDLTKGTQDKDFSYSFFDSLSLWSLWVRSESYQLKKGDLLEIPANCPRALFCDRVEGLQFHELVGDGEEAFQKRSTEFLVTRGYEINRPAAE